MIKKKKKSDNLNTEESIIRRRNELAKKEKVAAIWTRVSSADQYKNNNSIPTQIAACEGYCARNGIRVKKYFGGENESGSKAGELFLDMIGEVLADPEYNHIIVYDFDRFSRSSTDGIIYKAKAKNCGVTVKSVNQPIDENNILAEQIENIFIVLANIDNAMRKHKCHEGMVACINRGEWYSRPPFGYTAKKVGKKHIITVNEQGRTLKRAFEWIVDEPEIRQSEIIRRLRSEGLVISKQKLSQCLRNCFYCGLLEHEYLNGNRIEGCQEPLITKVMYWKVQDILNGNNSNYLHAKETPRFPLKGYLKSNKDGRTMTGYTVKKKNLDYYKSNGKGCNVSAKTVHAQFVEILNSLSVPDKFKPLFEMVIRQKFTEKEGEFTDRAQSVSKNLNTLRAKLKTAKTRYVTEDCISEDDYNEVKANLEQRITECEQELKRCSIARSNLAEYTSTTLKIAASLGSEWEKGDFEVCQKIQALVFPEGILWDNENRVARTENMNPFFAQIALAVRSVGDLETTKKDNPNELSCLVAGEGLEPPASGL